MLGSTIMCVTLSDASPAEENRCWRSPQMASLGTDGDTIEPAAKRRLKSARTHDKYWADPGPELYTLGR